MSDSPRLSDVWRRSAWLGLFGDAYLARTELQGGFPQLAIPSYAARLRECAGASRCAADVEQVCSALERAARVSVRAEQTEFLLREDEVADEAEADADAQANLAGIFRRHWDDIRSMRPGDFRVSPASRWPVSMLLCGSTPPSSSCTAQCDG